MKLFNLIVPVYNESHKVERFIKYFYESQIFNYRNFGKLVFVNDGSTDNTLDLLNKFKNSKIIILDNKVNLGYGGALKKAIEYSCSTVKYVVFIDSDLTNPIKDIYKIIPKMEKKLDLIKGNRFHFRGGIDELPFKRKFFTKYGNFVSRRLFDLHIKDCTNGFRAVKTKYYKKISLKENDFSIIMEELFKLKPLISSISEFDTHIGQRTKEYNTSSFNYSWNLVFKYFKYSFFALFYKNNYLKYYK